MNHSQRTTGAIIVAALALSACTAGNGSSTPPVKQTVDPINQSTLQFAVGTANIAGTAGINVVATLRQNAGPSVGATVLQNAPVITGPFTVTAPAKDAAGTTIAGVDAGAHSFSAFLQTNVTVPATPATLDGSGISAYGIAPFITTSPSQTPSLQPSALPFLLYSTAPAGTTPGVSRNANLPVALKYVGGPPAYPFSGVTNPQDGTYPGNFAGFTTGFTDFEETPVAGAYTMTVSIPTGGFDANGNAVLGTKQAAATLANATPLAAWSTPPAFVSDGAGGGTIATNLPADPRITEALIEVVDTGPAACNTSGAAPYYYTLLVKPGTATAVLPPNLGASKTGAAPTLCAGDTVSVYGVAFDYPAFESGLPQTQGQVAPPIAGAGGQADVTTSATGAGTE